MRPFTHDQASSEAGRPIAPWLLRLATHTVAGTGFGLTTATCTGLLLLLSPDSLTARAASGPLAQAIGIVMLVLAAIGWADMLWRDIGGRMIWPSLAAAARHQACVGLYAALSCVYAVLLTAAMDPRVDASWVLGVNYLLLVIFFGTKAVAIARENRP